jgi:prevent-host-death family protein
MKTSSVSETKNQLSALLDQVRRGVSILITDRGTAVARLVPAFGSEGGADERLARLERSGRLRRGRGRRLAIIADELPPSTTRPVDLLQVLHDEREDRT